MLKVTWMMKFLKSRKVEAIQTLKVVWRKQGSDHGAFLFFFLIFDIHLIIFFGGGHVGIVTMMLFDSSVEYKKIRNFFLLLARYIQIFVERNIEGDNIYIYVLPDASVARLAVDHNNFLCLQKMALKNWLQDGRIARSRSYQYWTWKLKT